MKKHLKYLVVLLMVFVITLPLMGCTSEDDRNREYATKLNSELAKVELLPIKDYANVLQKYVVANSDYRGAYLIIICKIFGQDKVELLSPNQVNYINDSNNYASLFVSECMIANTRYIRSGYFGAESLSIEDLDNKVRTDNYLMQIVNHCEIHCDLSKLDNYILKVEPKTLSGNSYSINDVLQGTYIK